MLFDFMNSIGTPYSAVGSDLLHESSPPPILEDGLNRIINMMHPEHTSRDSGDLGAIKLLKSYYMGDRPLMVLSPVFPMDEIRGFCESAQREMALINQSQGRNPEHDLVSISTDSSPESNLENTLQYFDTYLLDSLSEESREKLSRMCEARFEILGDRNFVVYRMASARRPSGPPYKFCSLFDLVFAWKKLKTTTDPEGNATFDIDEKLPIFNHPQPWDITGSAYATFHYLKETLPDYSYGILWLAALLFSPVTIVGLEDTIGWLVITHATLGNDLFNSVTNTVPGGERTSLPTPKVRKSYLKFLHGTSYPQAINYSIESVMPSTLALRGFLRLKKQYISNCEALAGTIKAGVSALSAAKGYRHSYTDSSTNVVYDFRTAKLANPNLRGKGFPESTAYLRVKYALETHDVPLLFGVYSGGYGVALCPQSKRVYDFLQNVYGLRKKSPLKPHHGDSDTLVNPMSSNFPVLLSRILDNTAIQVSHTKDGSYNDNMVSLFLTTNAYDGLVDIREFFPDYDNSQEPNNDDLFHKFILSGSSDNRWVFETLL